MNNLVTKGYGNKSQLITQGYGKLYIVVDPEIPSLPDDYEDIIFSGKALRKAIDDGKIQTRKIVVSEGDSNISVEVVLINYTDYIKVKANLEKVYQNSVKVFSVNEVKYHD